MSTPKSNADSIKTNVPEFSVTELSASLKKTLEENYGQVRVRGELSRVSIAASGHMYSNLKDDKAVIDAVCWKGTLSQISLKPEEGMEVICTGRISTYPARSNYQLIIESMELAGQGALLKLLEERKKKLGAEGLFDAGRKKTIPFLPNIIGVVTSPTGAVIRDILHRISDRFPCHVLVWPVLVQGEGAANQITAAIQGFNALDGNTVPRPDVLIIARGGGSLEDLMAFNEENVVRTAAASEIPLISAVGHETDTTLIDYAADLRAPTPTGAAEMAVPVRVNLVTQVMESGTRLARGATRQFSDLQNRLEALAAKMGKPDQLLETHTQRLDHIEQRMAGIFREFLSAKNGQMIELTLKIRPPTDRISSAQNQLNFLQDKVISAQKKYMQNLDISLTHHGKMLEAFSFKNVLKRGFAVIRDEKNRVIPAAGQLKQGQKFEVEFQNEQRVQATALASNTPQPPAIPKPSKDKHSKQSLQKDLFGTD